MSSKESKDKDNNEKLIKIAVQFLLNPKIENAPDETKKAFLKKKGLNDENIAQAFKLAKEKKESDKEKEKEEKAASSQAKAQAEPENKVSVEELIEKAKQSNTLFLKKPPITKIPDEVFQLTNLQVLVINGLKLEKIPSEISKLTNLTTLHAVDCNLYDNQLAPEVWGLEKLEELNLSKNKLTNVSNVTKLANLKTLDFSENEILKVPSDIERLGQLEVLNLRNNNISIIPEAFGKMNGLKKLYIKGNNLDPKLEDIIKTQGLSGLLKYLNEEY